MRASKFLTALVVMVTALEGGSPATAAGGETTSTTATTPPVSSNGATVVVQANASTTGSAGTAAAQATTVEPVVDPCIETRALGPAVGGGGLMVPLIVDNGGKRYAVYMRTCTGDPTAQVVWHQIYTPEELAQIAADRIRRTLPRTNPHFADPTAPWQFVRVPTIVWIDPTDWRPFTATANALETWTTVTVTPVTVRFDPGDGDPPVRCPGPGVPYTSNKRFPQDDRVFIGEPGQCGYLYGRSSKDAPNLTFPATVAVEWRVDWRASDGTSGTLAPILMTTPIGIKVAKVQAIGSPAPPA